MKMLILDTSKKEGFVALARIYEKCGLAKEGRLLDCKMCVSKEFLPHAAHLLQASKGPLDAIAVGIGPGSYTGTRSGATFAKTLAFAKNIPVIGFYSPLAYLPKEEGSFAYTLRGKRGDTSLLTGKKTFRTILEHTDPVMVPKEELAEKCAPFSLQVANESSRLNLPPLLDYLKNRFETQEYDLSGEVDIAYLYNIPAPAAKGLSKNKCSI